MKTENKWIRPTKPSDADAVFPGTVTGKYLPEWSDIPKEFRENWHGGNKYCDKINEIFHRGGSLSWKDEVDGVIAQAHLLTVLRSFEPKHEHKIAGAGYLLSLWGEV